MLGGVPLRVEGVHRSNGTDADCFSSGLAGGTSLAKVLFPDDHLLGFLLSPGHHSLELIAMSGPILLGLHDGGIGALLDNAALASVSVIVGVLRS